LAASSSLRHRVLDAGLLGSIKAVRMK